MSAIARLVAVVGLVVMSAWTPAGASARQEPGPVIDIADIPVPVDDVPEAGYRLPRPGRGRGVDRLAATALRRPGRR